MTKEKDENFPVSPTLKGMDVGKTINFPIHRYNVVKSQCSVIGLVSNLKFTTHIDRKNKTINVTRIQ